MNLADLGQTILEFVRTHQAWAPFIIFALTFAESMAVISLVLPAWSVIVAFGPLIAMLDLNFNAIFIAAALGASLGDWVSYILGYHFKERIGQMWPLSKYPQLLPKGEAFFRKWGIASIFIGRFSGPLRASLPLIAGITAMPIVAFQIANVVSAFIWAYVLLKSGESGFNFLAKFI